MATRFEIDQDRDFADFEVAAIIDRAALTINVIEQLVAQLGQDYATIPNCKLADYLALAQALETANGTLLTAIQAVKLVLSPVDTAANPLAQMNEAALPILRGVTLGKAQAQLVEQLAQLLAQRTPREAAPPPTPPLTQ